MSTVRLRVQLREVTPGVIRVIDVPAASTLDEVHELLQAGLGWTDSHLHEFTAGEQRYQLPDDDGFDSPFGPPPADERTAKVTDLPTTWTYLYDFGDGWTHDVENLGAGADEPGCVDGEGACPSEDCGGPPGYEDLLAVLGDPADPRHDELREWAGELREFDRDVADARVRHAAGRVPPGVRLVLDLAAEGVRLTPAGRFPRAFVRSVQEARPDWGWFGLEGRPAHREGDVLAAMALRELLRDAGLLRLRHGVLTPTRASRDDRHVLRRVRTALARDEFATRCAELALAMLLVEGALTTDQLAARIFPLLGPGWRTGDRPLAEPDVRRTVGGLGLTLRALDQIADDDRHMSWRAGPEARWLMPGVSLLEQWLAR